MTDPRDDFDDAALDELRALAPRTDPGVEWEQPPAGLWERIAAEAGVSPGVAPSPSPSDGLGDTQPERPAAPVRELRPRRRSVPWLAAAAAAAVVALVVGVAVTGDDPDQEPTVLASVSLEPLQAAGSGEAELIEVEGELKLRIQAADLDPGDGFLEVWLIDSEVTKLVSLGPVRSDGTYALPAGLDPEDFPVVDVSVEPLDGDPAHSGDSLLRGQLSF